ADPPPAVNRGDVDLAQAAVRGTLRHDAVVAQHELGAIVEEIADLRRGARGKGREGREKDEREGEDGLPGGHGFLRSKGVVSVPSATPKGRLRALRGRSLR